MSTLKSEITSSLNKDENKIAKLNQEYTSRTEAMNQAIKNNLIDSITLVANIISINYQNLIKELYSENTYQIILSSNYLNSLQIQYENKKISFNKNGHINFDSDRLSIYSSDVWGEWHWYWFAYWKVHLSYNAVTTIISYVTKLGGLSAATVNQIIEFIVGLMPNVFSIVTIIAVAVSLAWSFALLVIYSNNLKGCWLGILGVIPGIGWGSN